MKNLSQKFYDNSIRLDKIIWLASNLDRHSSDVQDAFEHDYEGIEKALGVKAGSLEDAAEDWEGFGSKLAREGKVGFLVQAATPIPDYFDNGTTNLSWGWFQSKWFYTEALDENFLNKLIDWRAGVMESEKKKMKSKKKVAA